LNTFCDKIIEKKEQFGSISNNQWFIRYISELKNRKKPSNSNESQLNNSSFKPLTANSSSTQNQTGIKSILSTFGLFSDNKVKKEDNLTSNPPNKSESITYDPVLKRYLINGEVPKEDGPFNKPETKKVEMKPSTILPPPMKSKVSSSAVIPENKDVKSEVKDVKAEAESKFSTETQQTAVNNPFTNNPFNVPKQTSVKLEAPKVVKKPMIININARYASAIDKK
jgi:hypothetical protein